MEQTIKEGLRLVRAQERLTATLGPMGALADSIVRIREVAPDLEPELYAALESLKESLEHLRSALNVVTVQTDLL